MKILIRMMAGIDPLSLYSSSERILVSLGSLQKGENHTLSIAIARHEEKWHEQWFSDITRGLRRMVGRLKKTVSTPTNRAPR